MTAVSATPWYGPLLGTSRACAVGTVLSMAAAAGWSAEADQPHPSQPSTAARSDGAVAGTPSLPAVPQPSESAQPRAGGPDAPAAAEGLLPEVLSLAQAERLLLERNPAIQAARGGVDAATANELIARYRPNPSLTVSAEQFNTRHPWLHTTSADPGSQGYQHFYTVRVDQLIERGGKRDLRRMGAWFQRQAAEATLQDTLRQQLFQLHQAYVAAVLAHQALELARDELRLTDQTLAMVSSQVDLGRSAGADLLRLQVSRVQVQQSLEQAALADQQALCDLLNLLDLAQERRLDATPLPAAGHPPEPRPSPPARPAPTPASSSGPFPAPAVASPPYPPSPPTSLPSSAAAPGAGIRVDPTWALRPMTIAYGRLMQAVETRGDVQAARQALAAADVSVRQARALAQEDVDLGIEYQRNGGDNTVGLSLQVPVPVFNAHRGDQALALAQVRQAEAQYRQIHTQAVTDLDKAWQSYQSAGRILSLYTGAMITTARESLRIAQEAYREGGTGLLAVLDALHAYNATCAGFQQAQASYRLSLYQLEQASGMSLAP